ncbi:phage portal protein [Bacillus sp. J14TS2]|uniref:phage tail assembly chaperone n=1 Tax=Bacillus sp. J14TS2 TaxID=2807188 RepID=UPI001BB323F1|nr:phage portal protein [Bacillus sp. J14TS2]
MNEDEIQSMDLSFFLPGNQKQVEVIKHPISKRFLDNDGNIIPFIFKAIATERIDAIEELNTRITNFKGRRQERVDYARFIAQVAVETTIYPDFSAADLRAAYKTEDPIEIAKKVLHVGGEYTNWIQKCSEINGFDDTFEELEESAKN